MTSTEEKANLENMSPEQLALYKKYGRLPNQSQLLAKKDKTKFFDSADWAQGKQEGGKELKQPSDKPIKE